MTTCQTIKGYSRFVADDRDDHLSSIRLFKTKIECIEQSDVFLGFPTWVDAAAAAR